MLNSCHLYCFWMKFLFKTHQYIALMVISTDMVNASISINQYSKKSHSNSHYWMAIKLMQFIFITLCWRNPVTAMAKDSLVIWLQTLFLLHRQWVQYWLCEAMHLPFSLLCSRGLCIKFRIVSITTVYIVKRISEKYYFLNVLFTL